MKIKFTSLLTVLFIGLTSTAAFAQEPAKTLYVPNQKELETKKIEGIDARRGLDGLLAVSANINLVQNSSYVGQVDGVSTVFGLGIQAGLDWLHGRHELRNTITIDETFSRTPVLAKFVKNNDSLKLSSQYNYFFLDWMGAFARLGMETAIFPNSDHRSEETNYKIKMLDGSEKSVNNAKSLSISKAFQPISLSQSAGIVSDPLRSEPINITARLGMGGRETFAKGVLIVKDDDKTPEVEVHELDNVFQFGLEAFVGGNGKFYDGRLTYDFGFSALIPFVNNDAENRSAFKLTRYGLVGSINFAVFSWMGLTYKLNLLNDPQILDKLQVQNTFLATFNYTFIERDSSKEGDINALALERAEKEKAAAEAKAKASEKRLQELEARAKEAEAKAAAAEAKAKAAEAEKAAEEAQNKLQDAESNTPPVNPETPNTPPANPPATNN